MHHSYATHTPLFWAALSVLAVLLARLLEWKAEKMAAGFFLGVLLHLVLDTVAGGVEWLWPFSTASYVLTDVPARHHPWVLNFLLHWTFGLEVAICVIAGLLFLRDHGLKTAPRSN